MHRRIESLQSRLQTLQQKQNQNQPGINAAVAQVLQDAGLLELLLKAAQCLIQGLVLSNLNLGQSITPSEKSTPPDGRQLTV